MRKGLERISVEECRVFSLGRKKNMPSRSVG